MQFHKVAILFFATTTFVLSCGRPVDDYKLKAGYRFHQGRVLYQPVKTWFSEDSIPFTVDSFVVVDTLPEFRRYVIAKYKSLPPLPLPDIKRDGFLLHDLGKPLCYGAADFDGNIIIFPRFLQWNYLGNGYVAVAHHVNDDDWGVLHMRGEMMTDMKYTELKCDSVSGKILGRYFLTNKWVYDSLNLPCSGSN